VKLSIYTFIKDGLYFDFHTVAMLRHHLPLADEIIVNEGFSTDGTYEAIKDIDPVKIRIDRNEWDRSDPRNWMVKIKETARRLCTGDWCINLDSDEFIPEWDFDRLRRFLETTDETLIPMRFVHFYGNYRVYKARWERIPHTPKLKVVIHRNLDTVEPWGDAANVRLRGVPFKAPTGSPFECHHFGEVRHPARLRQKWRTQAIRHRPHKARWDWIPSFVYDLLPHRWDDPDLLADMDIYDGPLIRAVRDDPKEFVRDGFAMYRLLARRAGRPIDEASPIA
jgi:glycosyltransferase involved in cell wall biosynthesis